MSEIKQSYNTARLRCCSTPANTTTACKRPQNFNVFWRPMRSFRITASAWSRIDGWTA
ncbi:hypothetical protein ACHAWF_010881 [Thalassiosira exigua]